MSQDKKRWTLTAEQLAFMQNKAYTLGMKQALQAVTDAGYSADKQRRIQEAVSYDLTPLNEHLHEALAHTPEAKDFFPKPH